MNPGHFLLCRELSPQQARAVRFALLAIDRRIRTLSRCGEKPSQAIEATLREVRLSPTILAEWIPSEPEANGGLPGLFRLHAKLIWRIMLSVKCSAGTRILAGEGAQRAIMGTIKQFIEATNKLTS